MGEIAVAIADDNERILDLLGEMIENNKEMKLVGKANNGEDVYTLIKEKQPDVVLLDLIMPKMDGLSVMILSIGIMISENIQVLLLSLQWDRSGLQKMHFVKVLLTIF